MRRHAAVNAVMTSLFVGLLAGVVRAQAPEPVRGDEAPAVVMAEHRTLTATVEKLDKRKHALTLRGPQGDRTELSIPEDAPYFEDIKVGDVVEADYLDAVAISMAKPGTEPALSDTREVQVSPTGEPADVLSVDTQQMTAKVEAIDYEKRLVTLKAPTGEMRTIRIDPSVVHLSEVKVGDEVLVRHTQAVGLALRKTS